jgi:hypothetical protein
MKALELETGMLGAICALTSRKFIGVTRCLEQTN